MQVDNCNPRELNSRKYRTRYNRHFKVDHSNYKDLHIASHKIHKKAQENENRFSEIHTRRNLKISKGQEPGVAHQVMETNVRGPESIENPPAPILVNNSYKETLHPQEELKLTNKQYAPIKNWGKLILTTLGIITLVYPLYLLFSHLLFSPKKNSSAENKLPLVEKTQTKFTAIATVMKSTSDLMLSNTQDQTMQSVKNSYSEKSIQQRVKTVQRFKREMSASDQGKALLLALRGFGRDLLKTKDDTPTNEYFILLQENGVKFAVNRKLLEHRNGEKYIDFELFIIEPDKQPKYITTICQGAEFLHEIFGVEQMAKFVNYNAQMPSYRIRNLIETAIATGDVSKMEKICKAIVDNPFANVIATIDRQRKDIETFLEQIKKDLDPVKKRYENNLKLLLEQTIEIPDINEENPRVELIKPLYQSVDSAIAKLIDEALSTDQEPANLNNKIKELINNKLKELQLNEKNPEITAMTSQVLKDIDNIYSYRSTIKTNSAVQKVVADSRVAFDEYNNQWAANVPVYISHLWTEYFAEVAYDVMSEMLKLLAKNLKPHQKKSVKEKFELSQFLIFFNNFYDVSEFRHSKNPLANIKILDEMQNDDIIDGILLELQPKHIAELINQPPKPKPGNDSEFYLKLAGALKSNLVKSGEHTIAITTLTELLNIFHTPEDANFALSVMPEGYAITNLGIGVTLLYLSGV